MPYSALEELDPPEPSTQLWRYMDFAKYASMLSSSSVWFARADTVNDPHEGAFGSFNRDARPDVYADMEPEQFQSMITQITQAARSSREHMFLNCWHASETESMAMWLAYARQGEGIAVRTSFGDLTASLKTDWHIFGGTVKYVDPARTWIPEGNLFYPYVHKRLSFAYESEVRLIATDVFGKHQAPGGVLGGPARKGFYADVDLPLMIQGVNVGPGQPEWYREAVAAITARFASEVTVTQSSLDTDPVY